MTVEELLEVARLHRRLAKAIRAQAAARDDAVTYLNLARERAAQVRALETRVAELEALIAGGDK
jgi:hypothetical protein